MRLVRAFAGEFFVLAGAMHFAMPRSDAPPTPRRVVPSVRGALERETLAPLRRRGAAPAQRGYRVAACPAR
jgi:hypothetical protein